MSESLETKYLSIPLVASELPLPQSQESPRRLNKKVIAGVSILLIIGCVIATISISSPEASISQNSIQLSSFKHSPRSYFSPIDDLFDIQKYSSYHISDDGKYVVYERVHNRVYRSIAVRSLEDSSIIFEIKDFRDSVYSFYFSPEYKTLVYHVRGCIRIVNIETKVEKAIYYSNREIRSYDLTKDNKYVIISFSDSFSLWSLEGESFIYEYKITSGSNSDAYGPRLSHDQKYIIFGKGNVIKMLDVYTQKVVYSIQVEADVYDAILSPDNKYIAYQINQFQDIGIISISNSETIFYQSTDSFTMNSLKFNNDSSFIAFSYHYLQDLVVIDLKNRSLVRFPSYRDDVGSIAFTKDGNYVLYVAGAKFRVCSLQKFEVIYTMVLGGEKDKVRIDEVTEGEGEVDFILTVWVNDWAKILSVELI